MENVVYVARVIPQVLTCLTIKTFCKMKIKFFAENKKKSQIIFECVENTDSAYQGKEFIVVNLDTDSPEMNFKNGLVADYLRYFAEHESITDWKDLDISIADIMNSKVHFI